eukprot:TRINITY_DN39582_c0_g1_i1.p1 TRINITY_DN39582_c0_g1~~TRINITY_DN39582_c0_g1_i1.p1  ORF type:complete len:298 (-),score=59.12 TRINITY_DN39582_c0_g1_i1:54-947(-)
MHRPDGSERRFLHAAPHSGSAPLASAAGYAARPTATSATPWQSPFSEKGVDAWGSPHEVPETWQHLMPVPTLERRRPSLESARPAPSLRSGSKASDFEAAAQGWQQPAFGAASAPGTAVPQCGAVSQGAFDVQPEPSLESRLQAEAAAEAQEESQHEWMQSVLWEQAFRQEHLSLEQERLAASQGEASCTLARLVKEAASDANDFNAAREALRCLHRELAGVNDETRCLWDALRAVPETLAFVQDEVLALEERIEGRLSRRGSQGEAQSRGSDLMQRDAAPPRHGSPPRISSGPVFS